jgi:iron(III) transport system substrate-binding protein
MKTVVAAAGAVMVGLLALESAAAGEVHVISQRAADPDAAPYADFTKRTGIKVVFVPNEGGKALAALATAPRGPGDVLIGTDAAGLFPSEQAGLFEPYASKANRAPARLRHPEDCWTAVSARARVIYARADLVDPPKSFADLAEPRFRGRLCLGSGASPYNLSVIGRVVAHLGPEAALGWAKGVVANRAPDVPPGRDGELIAAVADGRCDATLGNHYEQVRMSGPRATEAEKATAAKVRLLWPDQGEGQAGALINVTAAGLLRGAPNQEAARALIDHLATDEAQAALAGDAFMPAADGVPPPAAVRALGSPRWDDLSVAALGAARPEAERMVKEAGWPTPRR